ncbi:unnamed protein product, partial [Penicillium nalgiovense]
MAAWLDLVKENEAWDLVDTNRLEQLPCGLCSPTTDVFLNQSSVTQCFDAFPHLARNIFCHSSETPIPHCIRWFASAFNLTTDGLYNSEGLSKILKAAVDPSRRMFDVATANPAGCRIAIVASRT